MQIPDQIEAMTPAWFTDALQARAPGARATAVEVVDAHSGTTGRALFHVTWEGAALPERIFAKLAPTDPIQRAMVVEMGMGAREARFYRDASEGFPIRVARNLLSAWEEDGSAYIMLMEDLAGAGCSFPNHLSGSDVAVVRSAVEQLARFHAAFWQSPRFESDLAWIEPPMRSEFGVVMVKQGLDTFGAEQPRCFHEAARIYCEHHAALTDWLDQGPATLLHGDPHLGNMFVDDGTVGLLDWACVARGPALRDVGYFLGSSVDTDVRRAEQDDLIDRYVTTLAGSGGPELSRDDAWRGYRRFVFTSWISAVVTLAAGDRMQSIEVGQRAVARANAALEDLETTALLAEELGL